MRETEKNRVNTHTKKEREKERTQTDQSITLAQAMLGMEAGTLSLRIQHSIHCVSSQTIDLFIKDPNTSESEFHMKQRRERKTSRSDSAVLVVLGTELGA